MNKLFVIVICGILFVPSIFCWPFFQDRFPKHAPKELKSIVDSDVNDLRSSSEFDWNERFQIEEDMQIISAKTTDHIIVLKVSQDSEQTLPDSDIPLRKYFLMAFPKEIFRQNQPYKYNTSEMFVYSEFSPCFNYEVYQHTLFVFEKGSKEIYTFKYTLSKGWVKKTFGLNDKIFVDYTVESNQMFIAVQMLPCKMLGFHVIDLNELDIEVLENLPSLIPTDIKDRTLFTDFMVTGSKCSIENVESTCLYIQNLEGFGYLTFRYFYNSTSEESPLVFDSTYYLKIQDAWTIRSADLMMQKPQKILEDYYLGHVAGWRFLLPRMYSKDFKMDKKMQSSIFWDWNYTESLQVAQFGEKANIIYFPEYSRKPEFGNSRIVVFLKNLKTPFLFPEMLTDLNFVEGNMRREGFLIQNKQYHSVTYLMKEGTKVKNYTFCEPNYSFDEEEGCIACDPGFFSLGLQSRNCLPKSQCPEELFGFDFCNDPEENYCSQEWIKEESPVDYIIREEGDKCTFECDSSDYPMIKDTLTCRPPVTIHNYPINGNNANITTFLRLSFNLTALIPKIQPNITEEDESNYKLKIKLDSKLQSKDFLILHRIGIDPPISNESSMIYFENVPLKTFSFEIAGRIPSLDTYTVGIYLIKNTEPSQEILISHTTQQVHCSSPCEDCRYDEDPNTEDLLVEECNSCFPMNNAYNISEIFLTENKKCVSDCGESSYTTPDNECKACPRGCKDCKYNPFTIFASCTSCNADYFMYEDECVERCPDGTYGDEKTGNCLRCGDNCRKCDNKTYCNVCVDEWKLYGNRCFQNKCPPGSYEMMYGICWDCSTDCLECSSANFCTACYEDQELEDGVCYDKIILEQIQNNQTQQTQDNDETQETQNQDQQETQQTQDTDPNSETSEEIETTTEEDLIFSTDPDETDIENYLPLPIETPSETVGDYYAPNETNSGDNNNLRKDEDGKESKSLNVVIIIFLILLIGLAIAYRKEIMTKYKEKCNDEEEVDMEEMASIRQMKIK